MTEKQKNAQAELENYLSKKRQVIALTKIREELIDRFQIRSFKYDDDKVVASSDAEHELLAIIAKRDKLTKEIEALEDDLQTVEIRIFKNCQAVEKEILNRRYLLGQSLYEIRTSLGYSRVQVWRYHMSGLEKYAVGIWG